MPIVPTTVTGLTATAISSSSILLNWDVEINATSYKIERSTNDITYTFISRELSNTFTNTGLVAGTTYYYRVYAENECGVGPYDEASVRTNCIAPSVPYGVSVSSVSGEDTKLYIDWVLGSASSVDTYQLYRATGISGIYSFVVELNYPVNYYLDSGLTAGETYCYKVLSKKCDVLSDYSPEACGITSCSLPDNIVLTGEVLTSTSVRLNWTAFTGSNVVTTGYVVEKQYPAITGAWSEVISLGSGVFTYDVTGLSGNTTYGFRVYAIYTGCE